MPALPEFDTAEETEASALPDFGGGLPDFTEEAPQQPAKPWTPSLPPDVQHQMMQEFAQSQLVRDPAQLAIKQQEDWYRSRGLEPPKTPEQVIEEKVKKASMTGEEMQALGLPKWLAPIERGVAETAGAFSQPENLAWMGAAGVPGVGRVMGGAFMGQLAEQSTEEIVGGAADILKGNTEQGLQRITSGLTQGAAVTAPFGVGKAREMLRPTPEFQGPLATGEALVMPPGARAPLPEVTAPETVSPEVAAQRAAQMTREATATPVRPARGPELPSTPAEPQRELTVLEEIRQAGARTTAQVQALFPERGLTREEAADLRRKAWGEAKPTVTETTPVVPAEDMPDTPTATGVYPAVREVGGAVDVGEAGQTHPEIIKQEGLKAEDIDQRGFVKPTPTGEGEFKDREQTAQITGQPTEREARRQHSTDLPEAKGSSFLGQTKDVWTPDYLEARLAEEGNRRAIVNGINAAPELKRRVPLKPEARPETILKAIHDLIDARENKKASEAAPPTAPTERVRVFYDEAVKAFTASSFDERFGNMHGTGDTKESAIADLNKHVEDARLHGTWRSVEHPPIAKPATTETPPVVEQGAPPAAPAPEAKAKSVLIQRRIKEGIPPENIQIVVNKDPAVPDFGFVQVDEIHPERGNVFSSNAEQMRELGYDMPSQEVLMDLPAGKYRLPEVRNMIVAKKLGVRYRGTQMGRDQYAWDDPKAVEGMPSVVDFSVPAGTGEEGVAARLTERRAQYEEATGAPAPEPKAEAKPAETPAIPEALSKVAYLATYENGRFLHEARSRLTEAERKEVTDWAVKNNIGDPTQPQTEEAFFSKLAKYASDQAKSAETPAAAAAKVEQELQPGRITTEEVPRTTKGAKQAKAILIRELEKLRDEAPAAADTHSKPYTLASGETKFSEPEVKLEKVTIDIPGDGEFTVFKTKENLEALIQRAKGIETGVKKPFKEKLPGANIPADVWINSSEPTHELTVPLERGKTGTRKGKAITIEGYNLFLTSDGTGFTITEPTTGLRLTEYQPTIKKAIQVATDSIKGKGDFEKRREDGIAKSGKMPDPVPLSNPTPAAPASPEQPPTMLGPGAAGAGGEIIPTGPRGTPEPPTYGPSARMLEARRLRGVIAPVEPGEGIGVEASIQRGRDLLAQGADPEKIMAELERTKRFNSDDSAVLRAHGERLEQAAYAAADKYGVVSDEYEAAWKADSDWSRRFKVLATEWHKTGQSLQGETEIDTGTFHGLRKAWFDATGKDFTPKQAEDATRIAKGVKDATDAADKAKNDLVTNLDKETAKAPEKPPKPTTGKQGEAMPDTKTLWRRARAMLDAGETDFDNIRQKLAIEFGLPMREVSRLLAEPKGAKKLTDEMYRKMSDRRRLVSQAKSWLKNQQIPGWLRFIRAIPRVFFIDKIIGHGTVGMITHAGMNVFNPGAWKTYWPNFFRQYKLLLKPAYHERMMQDLLHDPNYTRARRAGLVNDPFRYVDDYNSAFVQYFRKLGLGGSRGFDSLKLFRQARFNQLWDRLTPESQTPQMAQVISDAVNHATGVVRMPFREWSNWTFFAPKLEGSRWAWMIGDPLRAAKTFADWRNSTPEARAFAMSQVKEKAAITGTYLGLLALNQGILQAMDSDQKINYTNPRRGDFLAFKVAGYQLGVISPMLGMVRLFANLIHASAGHRGQVESLSTRSSEFGELGASYLRGKLSPFAGFGVDIVSQADFQGRPMPYSSDRVPAYLRREGIPPYTYGEYAAQQFTPIPVSEAIREVWREQGMNEDQIKVYLHALTVAGFMGATGARLSTPSVPAPAPPARFPSFQSVLQQ